jgi:hypothetical protein
MSETVSTLDNRYVRLGHVAALLSRNGEQCAANDIMDLFKRALFIVLSRRRSRSAKLRTTLANGYTWSSRFPGIHCRRAKLS